MVSYFDIGEQFFGICQWKSQRCSSRDFTIDSERLGDLGSKTTRVYVLQNDLMIGSAGLTTKLNGNKIKVIREIISVV